MAMKSLEIFELPDPCLVVSDSVVSPDTGSIFSVGELSDRLSISSLGPLNNPD